MLAKVGKGQADVVGMMEGIFRDGVGFKAANQFFIAYQDISASQMFVRMLTVAIVEAGLALLFFMHLSENRGLKWFVLIFTVAVILGMQYGWTDSFRLSDGVPWAH